MKNQQISLQCRLYDKITHFYIRKNTENLNVAHLYFRNKETIIVFMAYIFSLQQQFPYCTVIVYVTYIKIVLFYLY